MSLIAQFGRNTALAFGLAAILGTTAFAADKPAAKKPDAPAAPVARELQFDELGHYFVKNTFDIKKDHPACVVASTQEAFDEVFGIGMVMGANRAKLLQEGDFDKNLVVSVIQQGNDIREIRIQRLRLEGKTLVIEVSNKVTEANASWTGTFHATVRMERCVFDTVKVIENGKERNDIPVTRP